MKVNNEYQFPIGKGKKVKSDAYQMKKVSQYQFPIGKGKPSKFLRAIENKYQYQFPIGKGKIASYRDGEDGKGICINSQ